MPGPIARLFDAMAETYDELEPWYDHLYRTLHTIVRSALAPDTGDHAPRAECAPSGRPGRALDAGCGTGFQTAVLEDLGYETHGVDISRGLLAVARQRRPASVLALADITALPYRGARFDVVTCCGSTLSLVEAPAVALGELARVLRPGGRLLLECEHKWNFDLGWAWLSGLTANALGYGVSGREVRRQLARPLGEGFWLDYPVALPGGVTASMRLRLFTMSELHAMLGAAGLTPLHAWGLHSITNLIPSTVLHRERLSPRLTRFFEMLAALDRGISGTCVGRRLANSLVILARKGPCP